jgi:hypothetical protein
MTAVNFPLNPTNGQTFVVFDKTYVYNSAKGVWNIASVAGSEGSTGATQVYELISQLPLSSVNTGAQAFVEENNRLYIWTGAGWFNIALINTNPTITQGPDPSYIFATDGTPIVITLLASDPEGIPITWSSQVTSGSLGDTAIIDQNNNVFTITPSTSDEDIGSFSITFTASDGVNIATAVSSFTLVFTAADQFYNQSVVLTTSNVNNSNNNVFVDSSTNNFAITRNGNTTQGTFTPFSPAGWSAYFDGTGDYLSVPDSDAFYLDGNFTVEAWVYQTSSKSVTVIAQWGSAAATSFIFRIDNTAKISFAYVLGSTESNSTSSTSTISYNQWNHIAWVRSGSIVKYYINGVEDATTNTVSGAFRNVAQAVNIGLYNTSVDTYFNGYISNLRFVKGTALYTTNFTPPTGPLTAVSGTSLLTLQDNRFIDRSTNNFAITRFGDTRITPFSPFLPQTPYDAVVHGGSGFFDGITSGLATPSTTALSMGTGDFTFEAWVYPTGTTTWQHVIGPVYDGNNVVLYVQSGSNAVAYGSGITLAWNGSVISSQWNHMALVRQSGVLWLFVNGQRSPTSAAFTGAMDRTNLYVGIQNTGERLTGYIASARVVKGTAVYNTSTYQVPTEPLTAVANTSLLLNFTNANIFDETGKIVVETVGTGQVSTSIVKYGDSSMFFNGSGNRAFIPPTDLMGFGSGDWTVECWVYPTLLGDYYTFFDNRNLGTGVGLYVRNGIEIASNTAIIAAGGSLTINTWAHVAFARSSNTIRGFINGSQVLSVSDTRTYLQIADTTVGGGSSTIQPFTGYISDLRITKGHARYTANFTPPTEKLGYNNAE